jgi:plastocyanin
MDTEKNDQQQFDAQVNRTGKLVVEVLGGVGIVAALMLSIAALIVSGDHTTTTVSIPVPAGTAKAAAVAPSTATVRIDHITRGCHTLIVNGAGSGSPSATIRLAAGGSLQIRNDDVMPHRLLRVSGPAAQLVDPAMNHMGARSTAVFSTPGTYALTTKAGEDYTKGIQTVGPDNTLRLKVIVVTA